ncbi:MAG: hypothetical protein MN733_32220 [Nitrososphaera sp.]|nr:hypothetical protein [Nitrososphaera sp.]
MKPQQIIKALLRQPTFKDLTEQLDEVFRNTIDEYKQQLKISGTPVTPKAVKPHVAT